MPDLSKYSTEELLAMRERAKPAVAAAPEGGPAKRSLADIPTEELLRMRETAKSAKPEPSLLEKVAKEAYAFVEGGGQPIAKDVPIVGPVGKFLGEGFRAVVEGGLSDKETIPEAYRRISGENDAAAEKFAKEHPVADTARKLYAGIGGGLALGTPGAGGWTPIISETGQIVGQVATKAAPGLFGALTRTAGVAAMSAADAGLRSGFEADKMRQAATLGGGIQAGFEAIPYVGKALSPLKKPASEAAKWTLSALGGAPKKAIDAYLDNPQAIKGAKSLEEIKDLADTELGKVAMSVDEARYAKQAAESELARLNDAFSQAFASTREKIAGKVGEAKKALTASFATKLKDLKTKSVPLSMADEIVGQLKNEKAVLGSLSEQADDALARSGVMFSKADVLDVLDDVGQSLGVGFKNTLVSDEAVGAAKKLFDQRQRIAEGFGDQITGPELREILREVRRDIRWTQSAGEFNDALNNARITFTKKLSDTLRGKVDEYASLMDRMHDISSSLGKMDKYFGTREQALAAFEAVAKSGSPRARVIEDTLQEYATLSGNKGLISNLDEFREARRIVSSPVDREALKASLPEARYLERAQTSLAKFDPKRTSKATELMIDVSPQRSRLLSAEKALEDTTEASRRFAGWSPLTTESRLKSVMAGRSIENRRALEELSKRTGLDFAQMLKDRNVADAFEKGFMHGSRNVNLWSFIGSIFGGKAATGGKDPIMQAFGAGFGASIDRFGPKMTQRLLDGFMALKNSKYADALAKAAEGGQAAIISTHLALQRDPEYRALMESLQKKDAMRRRTQQGGN